MTHRLKVGHGNGPPESLGGKPQYLGHLGPVPKVMMEVIRHRQRDLGSRRDGVGFKVGEGRGMGCHFYVVWCGGREGGR